MSAKKSPIEARVLLQMVEQCIEERTPFDQSLAELFADQPPISDAPLDYQKAELLYLAKMRENPSRAFNLMRNIIRELGASSHLITNQIDELLNPQILTPHGYQLRLEAKIAQSGEHSPLRTIAHALSKEGADWFINSGTLLGYVRRREIIEHDDDIDLAVLLERDNKHDAMREFSQLLDSLKEQHGIGGFRSNEGSPFHIKAWYVDIFPAWVARDGSVYVWPYCCGDVHASEIFPTEPCRMMGEELFIPRNPEKLLSINYGESWRTPDRSWKFDWERAERRFSDIS